MKSTLPDSPSGPSRRSVYPVQSAHSFPLTPLQAECYKPDTRFYASLLPADKQDVGMARGGNPVLEGPVTT
ncbi:protein of unknown function [Candidatus Methylomirabilis oxygeniifera]|uniref:Uncharacterized protein n=1 Tax=Methylomirabilis oxygeniifera TaxID=671143 RepID=D5MMQ7_METO1|nr:protein of unknown function [Candidatus Methylomirabilis oxyfera]